ncbi:hypothetical protein Mpet_0576 [Methanolacinia petrolearia DSM 11571]|uniref:Uncharacterized protein n=1 Tax=Methanolacinia petrolearia (strain DSM 11571 / OCM 486 / SEBR 4847) TaxID=679926 RepID=E1RHP1_METP4|nr:hypothetical protein [Methanolacinia petrolearia]ADN35350.1 hypothetical protein Mpet_0576 [Methanolacinia petrolearia DSM 11571]
MCLEIIAAGGFGILGTLLGTFIADKQAKKRETEKERKECNILMKKIEREIKNIWNNIHVLSDSLAKTEKITKKNELFEFYTIIELTDFFITAYEFDKVTRELIYFRDDTDKFDEWVRAFRASVNIFKSSIEIERSGSVISYDIKPLFEENINKMNSLIELVYEEFKKIK